MDQRTAAQLVKRIALEEGFDRAGIARLAPSATAGAFARWLEDGRQAGMQYLERYVEVREDPRKLLDGAASILCVAMQYALPAGSAKRDPLRAGHEKASADAPTEGFWPRVARYARGEDYHRFLRAALKRVARRIERELPGTATRACVDTAPLLEREWAARAGLGAVGKNTNLLHPEGGSWFLLGEILMTVDLASDLPIGDLCGECTRCLEACPTGALTGPFALDSERCISYWTIEHRGEIPDPVRGELAGWIFGCDICQEVCPWNRDPTPGRHAEFSTPAARAGLDLVGLLESPDTELRKLLRGSPLLRPGLEGLRRNARLALAETRERSPEATL